MGETRKRGTATLFPLFTMPQHEDNSSGVRAEALYSNKPPLMLIILGLFRINFTALSEDCGLRSDVVSDAAQQTCYTKTWHFTT